MMLSLSDCPKSPVPAPLAVMDVFLEYPYWHISDDEYIFYNGNSMVSYRFYGEIAKGTLIMVEVLCILL